MLDRKTIESTLQKIRSGELSPDQATEFLLGFNGASLQKIRSGELSPDQATEFLLGIDGASLDDAGVIADPESLAAIVDRLGVPPTDVVDAWCDQLRRIALARQTRTGRDLPPVESETCYLDTAGTLVCSGLSAIDLVDDEGDISPVSQSRIDAFRNSLIASPLLAVAERAQTSTSAAQVRTSPRRGKTSLMVKSLFLAGLLFCVVVAGAVIARATRDEPTATANAPSRPSEGKKASKNQRDIFNFWDNANHLPVPETIDDLEMIESMSEAEFEVLEKETAAKPNVFSLDAFMPAADVAAPDGLLVQDPASVDATSSGQVHGNAPEIANAKLGLPLPSTSDFASEDDGNEPDEAEQPTEVAASRQPTTITVELPSPDSSGEAMTLIDREPVELTLRFPFDVPLKLVSGGEGKWRIVDSRKDLTIAKLANASDGLSFTWDPTARQSAHVNSLVHGRLHDEFGGNLFLRPAIEAVPYQLRLQPANALPTWDLRAPIPPNVARISVDFDLPDSVEIGWIEPLPPDDIRRARGLAILATEDSEDVAIRMHLDVRCSRKLSCRLRFAGRLDSSMAWNQVTVPGLESFANQLTYQAGLVSNESQRLANVYRMTNSMGKRIIKMKQTRNDALAENIRIAADRVDQLQSLIATIEAEVTLRFDVWIEWPREDEQTGDDDPTGRQTVFTME